MKKKLLLVYALSFLSLQAYCQHDAGKEFSASLNLGMAIPRGDELSAVFDRGFILRPAVQQEFLFPNFKGEVAVDVLYWGNVYKEYGNEVRDNLWLYGVAGNLMYDVTITDKLTVTPGVGAGYRLGSNYLTSDSDDLEDKQKGLRSKGLSFNAAIVLSYKRFNLLTAYTLYEPKVRVDDSLLESVPSSTSDLYGPSFSGGSQKMDFSYWSISLGYKFLQL